MNNEDRQIILRSERLDRQIYLFVSDWTNYKINSGETDETKVKLIKKNLDNLQSTVYAVEIILISDPAILEYKLPTYQEKINSGIMENTTYEVDDTTVKSIVDSILENKTSWLL